MIIIINQLIEDIAFPALNLLLVVTQLLLWLLLDIICCWQSDSLLVIGYLRRTHSFKIDFFLLFLDLFQVGHLMVLAKLRELIVILILELR